MALFARGHCLLVACRAWPRRCWSARWRRSLDLQLQAHPVHARPDARRHHRHRDPPGGPEHRPARSSSCTGRSSPTCCWPTRSTARRPRRRPRCSRRCRSARSPSAASTLRAARAVLRAGHAEPDRAGRHLPAARGPARPLHVQHHGRLPHRRTRSCAIMKQTTGVRHATPSAGPDRRGDPAAFRSWCGRCRSPTTSRATPCGWSRDAARPRSARGARLRRRSRARGAPARAPASTSILGRQGARAPRTAAATCRPTTSGVGRTRSCATASSPPSTPTPRASPRDRIIARLLEAVPATRRGRRVGS